jgi:hypothetical protein
VRRLALFEMLSNLRWFSPKFELVIVLRNKVPMICQK